MVHQRRSRAPFWFPSGANTRYRLPTLGYKKYALACQCRFITSHTPDIMSAAVDPYADRKKLYSYETPADAFLWKNSNELVEDHDGGEEESNTSVSSFPITDGSSRTKGMSDKVHARVSDQSEQCIIQLILLLRIVQTQKEASTTTSSRKSLKMVWPTARLGGKLARTRTERRFPM